MVDPLYQAKKPCPICTKEFTVTRTRGTPVVSSKDTDFCNHYIGINPYYYSIWVCSNCGYAAQEERFTDLSEAAKAKIRKFLDGKDVRMDYGGSRTWDQAVNSHKLAIVYAAMSDKPASHLASLELRLAWLYREQGKTAEEIAILTRAVDHYEKAYSREPLPIGSMTASMLGYLIGELLRRIGKIDEALSYLAKVVGSQEAKKEKRIYEMARDAWQAARAEKKSAEEQEALV